MRLRVPFSALSIGLLVCGVACAGPHSSGALWSQRYVEQERVYFALTDVEHRAQAQQFELGLADESLAAENRRLDAALQVCPGPRQALAASTSDSLRDGIRARAQAKPDRLAQVAQVALADWYVRRASASGDARFCDRARMALTGTPETPATADLLNGLPAATVSRDDRSSAEATPRLSEARIATLSSYALGALDAVQAAAPLPQYLALVYGGYLYTSADSPPAVDAETAATLVDQQAPAFPYWEPDALYAALRGGQP
jgi:hypothetical protein